jgi:hypothetical protein
MVYKVLASLVEEVIQKGERVSLVESEKQRFYREFESEVSEQMESMRAEKRRAYEESKNITIR